MTRDSTDRMRRWIVSAAVLVLVAGVAAWRLAPRPTTPPSAEMRSATEHLVAQTITTSPPPVAPKNPKTDREKLLAAAHARLGAPYKWGAKGPDAYDCSGFTKAAYAAAGVALPDGSFNQADHERPLATPASLTPGDLLFYRWAGKNAVSHVTLYAGDGWVIGTGTPGQPRKVVLYPLAADLRGNGDVITYRHVRLPDER